MSRFIVTDDPVSQRPSVLQAPWLGRGARITLMLAAVTLVGFGIHGSAQVLTPILFGALFAAATQPLTKYLEHRLHFPTYLAVTTALLAVMIVLALACGTLFLGFMDIATDLPRYEAASVQIQRDLSRTLSHAGLYHFSALVQRKAALDILPTAVSATLDAVPSIIGFATLAGLVTLFGLLERDALLRRLGSGGEGTSRTYERVLSDTQKYLGVKSAVSAMTGLCAGCLCWLLGVPNAPLWGAIAFWLNFVPVVGSLIAAVPPMAIALVLVSPGIALAVGFGYFVINFVFGNLLEPKWQRDSTGLSPLMVIISIAVWGALLGPLGALLSVPLTMAVKIGCAHTRDLEWVTQILDNDFTPRLSMLPRKRSKIVPRPAARSASDGDENPGPSLRPSTPPTSPTAERITREAASSPLG